MRIIGIDPGLTGAIGTTLWAENGQTFVYADMMPKQGKLVDIRKVRDLIESRLELLKGGMGTYKPADLVVVEEMSPFPTKLKGKDDKAVFGGAVTNFRMGERLAELRTMCLLEGWPFITIKPISWKVRVFVGKNWRGNSKDLAVEVIQALYPQFDIPDAKYKKYAMCDALCLALYGKQFHMPQQEDSSF